MATPSEQYHALVNLSRAMNNRDATEKTLLICAYVYKLGNISERNLITIMNYAGINFQKLSPYRALHFFYSTHLINIDDNEMGLIEQLSNFNSKYTTEQIAFARQEIDKIGRKLIDG